MHTPLPETEEGLVYADIDLGMISLAKAAADPAGHYSRPDVTRLLLNKTPGDRVVVVQSDPQDMARHGDDEAQVVCARTDMPSPMAASARAG